MVSEKLASLRERLKNRRKKRRVKRKSQQLKNESERRKRERRIEENEPEGLSETAEATRQQAGDLAEEGRKTVEEETRVLASELGVSPDRVDSLMESASDRIQAAKESGTLSDLDIDGDGDTDLFSAVDPLGGEAAAGQGGEEPIDPVGSTSDADVAPVQGDPAGADMTEPVDGEIEF